MEAFDWICCVDRGGKGAPAAASMAGVKAAAEGSASAAPPQLMYASTGSASSVSGAAVPEPSVRPMVELKKYYDVDWSPKGELGKGHFARVYRGTSKATGAKVAAKRISRTLTRGSSLQNEIKALISVSGHPNIVKLYDVFYDDIYVVLILEFLGGGELFARIVKGGAYSERDASRHARALASALNFMHERGVVHRDLKPENLVLAEPRLDSPIKISDFGLSKILNDDAATMKTVCGTRAYSAPEIGFGNPKGWKASYTAKVDVWSMGVILYVLLGAYHPFDPYGEGDEPQIWVNMCRGDWDFNDPVWERVSDEAKDLLTHMICVDPEKRYSAAQVLAHPWIQRAEVLPDFNLKAVNNQELRNVLGEAIDTASLLQSSTMVGQGSGSGSGIGAAAGGVAGKDGVPGAGPEARQPSGVGRDVEMKDMDML